jgi:hypothetical protein
MAMILLYYVLLAVWPLLLWPALRLKGWSRGWLIVTAVAGALATAHEVRMFLGPPAAIRLDVFLIAMVLGVLYAGAAAVLFLGRRRKSAAVVGVAIVVIGGGMSYLWSEAGRQTERLTRAYYEGQALLFEAKFRSPEAYADYFRIFDARPTLAPVGHWAPQGGGESGEGGFFTRLIVNPEGRAWAFHPCGQLSPVTECMYRAADPGIKPLGDVAGRRWEIPLVSPSGSPFTTVTIAQTGAEQLTLEGMGEPLTFVKTPPPIDPAPAPARLSYLGPFTQMECRGPHAAVRQLWLWQEDARLYAVGFFQTLLAGQQASYVSAAVLGEGARQGDGWRFDWRRNKLDWSATVILEIPGAPEDPGVLLTLTRGGETIAEVTLEREAIIRDEAIELAPLTGKADWDHWFDIVLSNHFSSGDVPAC